MGQITSKNGRPARPANAEARLPRFARRLDRLGILGLGVAIGFGAASVVGSLAPSDRTPAPTPAIASAPEADALDLAAPIAEPPFRAKRDDALSQRFAEWLADLDSNGLGDMAREATDAGLDLLAESVIRGLDEEALASLITSTTDYSSAELAEIDDVPGFAMGLARIAMEGTVRDAAEPEEPIRPIDFAEEITWDHRAAFPQSQFPADATRIYAVFESDALGLSETLAKWTRVDDGEILLFKRHRIRPAAGSSYVFLDAPPTGFAPGEYRVDFYSADQELRWLASGAHRVTL